MRRKQIIADQNTSTRACPSSNKTGTAKFHCWLTRAALFRRTRGKRDFLQLEAPQPPPIAFALSTEKKNKQTMLRQGNFLPMQTKEINFLSSKNNTMR